MADNEILLSIKDLCVDFSTKEGVVHALKNVSFDIPKGKTIGLVGESGSGKSVTSLATMGLIPNPPGQVTNGQILYKGKDLLKYSESEMRKIRGNDISMIFQEPMTSLNPVFTVGFQIAEVLRLHQGMSQKEARERTLDLLNQVGIPTPHQKIDAYPHELSGGQKQRIMIAMAIGCEPDLLICDEPTTALDVTIQKQVLDLMLDLQTQYDMSMLFITHDLGVIADIADEVVVMYRGDIVEKNTTEEIFLRPQHPYTKGLLACRPALDKHPKRLVTVSDYMDVDGKEKTPPKVEFVNPTRPISETENPVILDIKGLKKYFPIRGGIFGTVKDHFKAVDGVDFQVRKGRTFGLVGESGCGKTTLGRTILRLIEPTEGQIIWKGKDIVGLGADEMRALRRDMQIIFQDPYASLNPRMTIGAAIIEPMEIHNIGANKQERLEKAATLLERCGLPGNVLNRYPHEFSGGQRQRVCIARALAVDPEFIICDESVSALDVSIQAQILNLLMDLQDELDLTYIFISHDLAVVKFISDEVMVMNEGKIVEMADAETIYLNPKMDYTKRLLSAIPKGIPKTLLDKGITTSDLGQ
ncbi:ABC transporter ATP-binding protein [bacterium]|nr:ABC transporter ATP-binding protein [bacterium]